MQEIKFSNNWNNKLDCDVFTTLRLSNRWEKGEQIKVIFKNKTYYAEVIDKRWIYLNEINDYIAYIDTGYNAEECKKILQTMYKNSHIDWKHKKIWHYLIKKVTYEKEDLQMEFFNE